MNCVRNICYYLWAVGNVKWRWQSIVKCWILNVIWNKSNEYLNRPLSQIEWPVKFPDTQYLVTHALQYSVFSYYNSELIIRWMKRHNLTINKLIKLLTICPIHANIQPLNIKFVGKFDTFKIWKENIGKLQNMKYKCVINDTIPFHCFRQ